MMRSTQRKRQIISRLRVVPIFPQGWYSEQNVSVHENQPMREKATWDPWGKMGTSIINAKFNPSVFSLGFWEG